jgi:TetR/AcrR family transcriptional regulator
VGTQEAHTVFSNRPLNSKSRKIEPPEDCSPDRNKAILDAARKRFAYYGFSKVTMDEIASDVAMGKASLYYYFPTKESIFKGVIAHEQKQFLKEMESITRSNETAREKLAAYARRRLLLYRDFLNLGNFSLQKSPDDKALFRDLLVNFEKEELRIVQHIIQLGRRSGEFSATLPQNVAGVILHALHGLRLRAAHRTDHQHLDDEGFTVLKKEMQQLVDLILAGLSAKQPSGNLNGDSKQRVIAADRTDGRPRQSG